MSRTSFDRILGKIEKHARFVCLFNWGEPFAHKDLLSMVRALTDRNIPTHLDSNLSVRDFSDAAAEDVVRSGLFSLFASIDGVSQEAYEKYRVGGRVDRALGNLRQLVRARKRLGSETPGLMWCYYVNRHNEHEIEQARALAREIGVDIWFKPLSAPADFLSSAQRDGRRLFDPPASLERWHAPQVNQGLERFELHPLLPTWCRQPFTVGVINWNGDVFPCCVVEGDAFKLGNLLEQDVDDVWNGDGLRACRTFLANFGPVQNGASVCERICTAVPNHA